MKSDPADGAEPEIRRVEYRVLVCKRLLRRILADRIKEQIDPSYSFCGRYYRKCRFEQRQVFVSFPENILQKMSWELRAVSGRFPKRRFKRWRTFTREGYRIGFINTGKDLSKKSVVNIRYSLGFERVIRASDRKFSRYGVKTRNIQGGVGCDHEREHHKIGYFGACGKLAV